MERDARIASCPPTRVAQPSSQGLVLQLVALLSLETPGSSSALRMRLLQRAAHFGVWILARLTLFAHATRHKLEWVAVSSCCLSALCTSRRHTPKLAPARLLTLLGFGLHLNSTTYGSRRSGFRCLAGLHGLPQKEKQGAPLNG